MSALVANTKERNRAGPEEFARVTKRYVLDLHGVDSIYTDTAHSHFRQSLKNDTNTKQTKEGILIQ